MWRKEKTTSEGLVKLWRGEKKARAVGSEEESSDEVKEKERGLKGKILRLQPGGGRKLSQGGGSYPPFRGSSKMIE